MRPSRQSLLVQIHPEATPRLEGVPILPLGELHYYLGSYAEELYLAYSDEMSLRERILADLVSQEDRDTLTGHLICWIHQPYITDTVSAHLDAMLIECGLRSS